MESPSGAETNGEVTKKVVVRKINDGLGLRNDARVTVVRDAICSMAEIRRAWELASRKSHWTVLRG